MWIFLSAGMRKKERDPVVGVHPETKPTGIVASLRDITCAIFNLRDYIFSQPFYGQMQLSWRAELSFKLTNIECRIHGTIQTGSEKDGVHFHRRRKYPGTHLECFFISITTETVEQSEC